MMKIENSLEWQEIRRKLELQLRDLDYNPQYAHLLRNIDAMVTELAKCEVEARRQHKPQMTKELLDRVNSAIDFFDKMVLFNRLSF